MEKKIRAAITGIAGWVPDNVLTNFDLEKMVDTTDDWIVTRTGVRERRILKGDEQGTSVIATHAVEKLLKKTGTDPMDIDLVICSTSTPDMAFPATANIVCHNLGMLNACGYDQQAACSGFIYAISTASQFIETGKYTKIIVIGADKMSSIIDYEDRSTCIIFGDGGGAALMEPTTENVGIHDFLLKSDGSGGKYLCLKAGGSRRPASQKTVLNKEHYVYQMGSSVFKMATTRMCEVSLEIMERNHLNNSQINYFVPHQANIRIIKSVAKCLNFPMERVMHNIAKYGNTTSGTIPLCLADYENKLRKGDRLILTAFGGGFTWGSAYLSWAYDGNLS